MTTTITRLYATKSDADAAIADLREHGFSADEIFVVSPPSALVAAPAADNEGIADEIAASIARGFILKRHAAVYAKKVAEGAVLITVYAPSGSGYMATVLLDRHDPIDSGVASEFKRPPKYDESAPVSSALWMPVHAADPTPFATFWNLPTLLGSGAPLSEWLGYGTHASSRAPLSTLLGLPVLTKGTADMSSSFGLPLTM
jgi:hypothetical protein